ncbi:MAG TPA: phosphohydrolase [Ruminococcaceae bacterium]|nr:phosphohydrolase [Oscillospiraceae bacterium]
MEENMKTKIESFRSLLQDRLSEERFTHSVNVSAKAKELAERFDQDPERAEFAGLVHDITKELSAEEQLQTIAKYSILLDDVERVSPKLWHAITGAAVLEHEYGITDAAVIDAVRWHTTARKGLPLLSKIIYLADCISKERDFPGVDAVRAATERSLDAGCLEMLTISIRQLLDKGALLHLGTVEARNELMEIK